MDFAWTAEELELRDSIAAFCRRELGDDKQDARDQGSEFSRTAWDRCAGKGLLGLNLDERWGGSGLGPAAGALMMEALGHGAGDLGLAFSIAAHAYACAVPIQHFGTEEQKREWLPRLASGEAIASHTITEPEAGSDVFGMQTVAKRTEAGYVLDGTKCFATNAPIADVFLIHAATAPGRGFFGLSAFLVDARTPGLTVGRAHDKIGLRTSPMSDLWLEDCTVPESCRLGEEGAGAAIFTYSMTWERTCLFAIYVGAMARQLEETIAYAKERKQFGQAIGKFQGVSHKIVDMKVRLEAARLLLYRSAWKLGTGEVDPIDAAITKLFVSESAVQSGLDAIQIHGGAGVMSGRIERYLRDAIPARIFSGTSEIQKNNIAKGLGL